MRVKCLVNGNEIYTVMVISKFEDKIGWYREEQAFVPSRGGGFFLITDKETGNGQIKDYQDL